MDLTIKAKPTSCFIPHCVSTAGESQAGHGEEAVSGQLGELQEAVRQTQMEGKFLKHNFLAAIKNVTLV